VLLCPDCRESLPGPEPTDCARCGWKLDRVDGIPVLLSTEERESPTLRDYVSNYEQIARDDLTASIQPSAYLERQADTLFAQLPAVRGRRVCELGIGQGMTFERLLAAEPKALVGIDVSLAYLHAFAGRDGGATQLTVALANAETLPYADEFDVLVASEILEHVLNLGDLLISAHRALRPDGSFVVRVPNREDLRQYARQSGCEYPYVHLRAFTRDSLVDLLRHAGFRARRIVADGRFPGRPRRWPAPLERYAKRYRERRFGDEAASDGLAARLLLEPVTLTGVFEKE
jgi:SAM-dependent methyltransferase